MTGFPPEKDISEFLERGVATVVPAKDLLKKELLSGKKLNVYFGIDPTAKNIHLGHSVLLRKLNKLVELDHNVTFLIGDFTALIGDSSDKMSERPILTSAEITSNFKLYKNEAEKFLDFKKVKIAYNSEWLKKLGFEEILKLVREFSLNDFIGRELIKKRLASGSHIRLDEALYPVLQGYDSYFLDTDLQLGGADQIFNMQAGRILQKNYRGKESYILSVEYLLGTDGRKMSKSWNNAIWLSDSPSEIYGKVMSLNDDLIISYFTLATDAGSVEIEKVRTRLKNNENPMVLKKELAKKIVTEVHGKESAEKAETEFEKTFQNRNLPESIQTYERKDGETIEEALVKSGTVKSKSDAKRLLESGAIEINGEKAGNIEIIPEPNKEVVVKVGKRRFLKII